MHDPIDRPSAPPPPPTGDPAPATGIRAAAPCELETILDVQEQASRAGLAEVFPPPHALPSETIRERWRGAFTRSENRFRVLERDGEIAGVCMVSTPWLHALQVLPRWWGTGVAAALHDDALEVLRGTGATEALLRCFADNARARRFWEKHGWEPLPWTAKPHAFPPHPEVLTYCRALY